MKKIYLLATALAALVSCTSDDFTGEKEPLDANGKAAISFDLNTAAVTRAEGSGAASALRVLQQYIAMVTSCSQITL